MSASEVDRQRRRPGTSPAIHLPSRRAGTRDSTRRSPCARQVEAEVVHQRAVVLAPASSRRARRPPRERPAAGGEEELPELARVGAVGVRRAGHAPGRIRTCDLALRRRALYPLSYGRWPVSLPPCRSVRLAAWRSMLGSSACSSRRRSSSRARRRTTRTSCTSPFDARGRHGLRRGGAGRALRRVGRSRRCDSSTTTASSSATIRSRSRTSASVSRPIPASRPRKSALDAALHDLQGKLLGVPAFRLLGLPRAGPPTSWTIWLGDPDDMARRAEKAAEAVPAGSS